MKYVQESNGSILRPVLKRVLMLKCEYKTTNDKKKDGKANIKLCHHHCSMKKKQCVTLQIENGFEAIFILRWFFPVPLSFIPLLVFISCVTLVRPGPRLPCYLNDVLMLVKHYCEWLSSIEAVLARRVNIS